MRTTHHSARIISSNCYEGITARFGAPVHDLRQMGIHLSVTVQSYALATIDTSHPQASAMPPFADLMDDWRDMPSTTAPSPSPSPRHTLQDILRHRQLSAVFQPIVDLRSASLLGYEGLIRGPADHHLHAPLALFTASREVGLELELERAARKTVLETFARLNLPGKLFLNVSPSSLAQPGFRQGQTLEYLQHIGLPPNRVIIELTEHQPTHDFEIMREAVLHYRRMGFTIAIDDLGEGFSSLRLWSELRPEFVKLDMHFVRGINQDPIKLPFAAAIQQIAASSGAQVIAEGIETAAELTVVRDIGISFGQGYLIAFPSPQPVKSVPDAIQRLIGNRTIAIYPGQTQRNHTVTAERLLQATEPVTPETPNDVLFASFDRNPDLFAVPVLNRDQVPIGLINRHNLIDRFARPFRRELYGRRPCTLFMDPAPMVVDRSISVQELSQLIVDGDQRHLSNGFIITDGGRYLGIGTGHQLMREITELQIKAARYANPLTQLPGNVPISEHTQRLLASGTRFAVAYCDLDHFKPYNDIYGYARGDDVIQLTAQVLNSVIDSKMDFIGHVGGDDFVLLLQSADWEVRCRQALIMFDEAIKQCFADEHVRQGGYVSEDRMGQLVHHPLVSLSIGVVLVEPGRFGSHHEVATCAAEVKKCAKKQAGSSLFMDRRGPSDAPVDEP